ncbi:hypothetical protein M0Q50_07265 [bacterium]|jgi:hypothetical protein|nr:hypothetical protein [bacterium]
MKKVKLIITLIMCLVSSISFGQNNVLYANIEYHNEINIPDTTYINGETGSLITEGIQLYSHYMNTNVLLYSTSFGYIKSIDNGKTFDKIYIDNFNYYNNDIFEINNIIYLSTEKSLYELMYNENDYKLLYEYNEYRHNYELLKDTLVCYSSNIRFSLINNIWISDTLPSDFNNYEYSTIGRNTYYKLLDNGKLLKYNNGLIDTILKDDFLKSNIKYVGREGQIVVYSNYYFSKPLIKYTTNDGNTWKNIDISSFLSSTYGILNIFFYNDYIILLTGDFQCNQLFVFNNTNNNWYKLYTENNINSVYNVYNNSLICNNMTIDLSLISTFMNQITIINNIQPDNKNIPDNTLLKVYNISGQLILTTKNKSELELIKSGTYIIVTDIGNFKYNN